MTYADTVLAKNPIGLWLFQEASGSVADNEVVGGSDASYSGSGITYSVAGPSVEIPSAVSTDGSAGQVTLPSLSGMLGASQPQSWEMWFNPTLDITGSSSPPDAGFIGCLTGSTFLCGGAATGSLSGEVFTVATGGSLRTGWSGITIPAGWHHLVAAYSGTANGWSLIIDGVTTAGTKVSSGGGATGFSGSDTHVVGMAHGATTFAAVTAAGLALYDYELSEAQALENYQAGIGATSPTIDLHETLPELVDSLTLRSYTPTDTSNGWSGRIRGGYAIHADNADPVTLPAAAATRRDKALWYPEPELVDGRPVGPPIVPPDPESSVIPQTIPFTIGV